MTPEEIASAIRQLTMEELVELNRLLSDWPGWGGVREPREPVPVSPGDRIAEALPDDYWESAE